MKLTRREYQLNELHNAPLDADTPLPPKRKPRTKGQLREWHLQAACVKLIRERQRVDKRLRFIVADPARARTPTQQLFAKMAGMQAGIPDLVLLYAVQDVLRVACVELKMPGKPISAEQLDWFNYFMHAGVLCHRCDSLSDFATILDDFCGAPGGN